MKNNVWKHGEKWAKMKCNVGKVPKLGIEPCQISNWGAYKWNALFHLSPCGKAKQFEPISMPRRRHVVQYMAVNTKTHAKTHWTDQMTFWTRNPNAFINIHRVLEAQEQMCPEMQNTYIIGFLFPRTPLIHIQFNLIPHVSKDSKPRTFTFQT
jgi:hypothetical protein